MIQRNRSRFDVRSSRLVAPPVWIEHPIERSSSSSPSPNHDFITSKYRFTNKNFTFYEDNHDHTFKVNHFTINDGLITIQNQKSDSNHFLRAVDYPLNVDYPLDEHNCTSIDVGQDNSQSKDSNGSLDDNDHACDYGKRNPGSVDARQIPDTDGHRCNLDAEEEEEEGEVADEDTFTFATTSVADSMEFFQLMRSSSSRGASKAGEMISVLQLQEGIMSPADELFEGGKIRPLMVGSGGRHFQQNSSNGMCHHYLPSKNRTEAIRIDHGILNGGVQISGGKDDDKHMVGVPAPFKLMSSSAPVSPAKEVLAKLEKEKGITLTRPEINFKRCRSLTRAFHIEDNTEKTLEETLQGQHYDGKAGGGIKTKRTTLQDFLHQEEFITLKSKQDQKQELLWPKASNRNVSEALQRPSPINLPHSWPTGEHLLLSTKKKVRSPSPHVVHYTFHKAQADKRKRQTFLPYHPRLLGCLGYPPH